MKIAVVGLRGIPNVMGGIETHCQKLYPALKEKSADLDVTVIARSPYVDGDEFIYKGVRVCPIFSPKNKYFETITHTFLSVIYTRFVIKADLIHIHAIGPALMAPLARLFGMKVLVTHHGEDYNRAKWNFVVKTLLRIGEAFAVYTANHVMVVGRSLARRLQSQYSRENKISYVPNGMSVTSAKLEEVGVLEELGIQENNYLVFVGRIVPEKGVEDLIQAFQLSSAKEQGLKLVIVGGADHKDQYVNRISLLANEAGVILAGVRKCGELEALFRKSALFVLPSYHEGLPIVLLEALSYGCRVLVSDIEPNKDVLLPGACYFETGNINKLSSKLCKTRLDEFEVDGDVYLKNYDWGEIAQDVFDVIRRVT